MKCKECDQEVANIGALTRHKLYECPARQQAGQDDDPGAESETEEATGEHSHAATAAATVQAQLPLQAHVQAPANPSAAAPPVEAAAGPGLIPLDRLPPQVRILAPGQSIRLKVFGRVTPEGVVVETAEFWQ